MKPITKREELRVLNALHEAVNGKKICFIVPSTQAIKKYIQFVYEMRSYLCLVNMTEGRIRIRTSPGEIKFFATCTNDQGKIEGLRGLEFDGVFVDESEPVPDEVFARVRKRNVKN